MRFACLVSLVLSFLAAPSLAQSVDDPDLAVTEWVGGFNSPTGLALLPGDDGDMFVIEKDTGRVKLVQDRQIDSTVLDLPVANSSEQGLLGIALHPRYSRNKLVYLYYTRAKQDGGDPIEHRIEYYRFNGERLVFQKRVKSLPGGPGPNHDGGKITFGPDGKLYAVLGDLNRNEQNQNFTDSRKITHAGTILRLNPGGTSPTDNPFYRKRNIGTRKAALNDIYAYGVRNSFGIEFDPETGALWDTENGPSEFDEINRVRRGFNSGWESIMGPKKDTNPELVSFGRAARYADPRFTWQETIGVTDLEFPLGTLGAEHENTMLIGDNNTGRLYRFELNQKRLDLSLGGSLADRFASSDSEVNPVVFGEDFGVITDLARGSQGVYALDLLSGSVYRIAPSAQTPSTLVAVPEPGSALLLFIGLGILRRRR